MESVSKSDFYIARVRGLNIAMIPKCGNTSMRWAILSSYGVTRENGNRNNHQLNLCLADDAPEGTIAFIRDPYDRAVSAWANKLKESRNAPGSRNMVKSGFTFGAPFSKYVRDLERHRDKDVHSRPQVSFVRQGFRLYRFESLPQVWRELQVVHEWLPDLGHDLKTNIRPREGECLEAIKKIYADDYSLWQSI